MSAAIVTYADSGAGPAIVDRLTEDGFAVTALARSPGDARANLGTMVGVACRDAEITLLVNNAPPFSQGGVVDTPTAAFAAGLDEGLNAVFSACREAAAAASSGAPLTIVNVVSALGMVGLAARSAEACSAAGVLAATKALAAEWGPMGIRVAAIVAGPTTDWGQALDDVAGKMPLGRFVTHEDVAAGVSFLAGQDAAAVAGPALIVDGGWLAYGYREDSPDEEPHPVSGTP